MKIQNLNQRNKETIFKNRDLECLNKVKKNRPSSVNIKDKENK